jgi:hypothetical protein
MGESAKVTKMLRQLMPVTIAFINAQFAAGADIVVLADHATRNLVGPYHYEQYLLPIHQEITSRVGGPVILHVCGNCSDRLELFARSGVDGYHFEWQVDSKEAVRRIGDKISLCGNVNNPQVLLQGTPEDVHKQARYAIEAGVSHRPGVRHPLSTPIENLRAIVRRPSKATGEGMVGNAFMRTPRGGTHGVKTRFQPLSGSRPHKETDRPAGEILIDYSIQSKFLGTVTADDLVGQVEFWAKAGYDFIPITVSMMSPGKVTEESKITRVLKEMVLREKPGTTDPKAWNLEMTSFIHERPDLDKFPWEAAADIDFSKLHAVKKLLPEGMKVIVVSGKIFTLTWMLMGFNNFALKLVLDESLVAEVFERVAIIQFKALRPSSAWNTWRAYG